MSTKTRCKKDVKTYMKGSVPNEFVDFVVDELEKIKGMSGERGESFYKMSAFQRHKLLRAMKDRQAIMAANLEKTADFMNKVTDLVGKKTGRRAGIAAGEALLATLSKSHVNKRGLGLSAEAHKNRVFRENVHMFVRSMEKDNLMPYLHDNSLDKEVMIELHELRDGGEPGRSGSVEAQKIAKNLNTLQNKMVDDINEAGVPMRKLDGYIMRQMHDPDTILKLDKNFDVAKRKWAERVFPLLDQERMFTPDKTTEERMKILEDIADTLVNGKFNKADSLAGAADELITTSNVKNISKQLLQERVLHFADGESFYKYNSEFGKSSLYESITQSVFSNSKAYGSIKALGSSPEAAVAAHIKRVQNKFKNDPEALAAFEKKAAFAKDKVMPEIVGYDLFGVSDTGAKITAGLMTMQNLTKLGSASLWSVSDLATGANSISVATGQSYFKSFYDQTSEIIKQINPKYKSALQESMQVYTDEMVAQNWSRFGLVDEEDFLPGWTKDLQNQFFTYTGLNWITSANRNAAAKAISKAYGSLADFAYDDLDDWFKASLDKFEVGREGWDELRLNAKEVDGKKYIVPGELSTSDASRKFQLLMSEVAEYASPEPSARSNARMKQGTKPGTIEGAVARFWGQFKSFPVFMHDVMMRVGAANPQADVVQFRDLFRKDSGANYRGLAELAAGTTVMALLGQTLVNASKNEKPPDLTDLKTWKNSFVRGGSAGLLGDLILTDQFKYGGGPIKNFAGPVLGSGEDLYKIYDRALKGKDVGKQTFDFAVRNTVPNAFYLKTGMDYLILDNIRESLEPGYKARKARRQLKENRDKLF